METASDAMYFQTLAKSLVNNVSIKGGKGSAWSMAATSAGANVLTVASTAGVRPGHVFKVSGFNLGSGQPQRIIVRSVTATTITVRDNIPAGSYTITHLQHSFVGAMMQQCTIRDLKIVGADHSGFLGVNDAGFGCTDLTLTGLRQDWNAAGWYEGPTCAGNRYISPSFQYSQTGVDLTFDGAISPFVCGLWTETPTTHAAPTTTPMVEVVGSSLNVVGHFHGHNGVYRPVYQTKDARVDVRGFGTTTSDLPVNPSVAGRYALAIVDGGIFHADWGADFTNVIGGVPLRDTPELLVVNPAGSTFPSGVAATSGFSHERKTTQTINYRVSFVLNQPAGVQDVAKPFPGAALNARALCLGDGMGPPSEVITNDAFSANVGNNLNLDTGKTYRIGGTTVLAGLGAPVADAASATYAAPAGGATIDAEARTALAQLAADVASLRTSNNTHLARARAATPSITT